jgi:guanylate kinase
LKKGRLFVFSAPSGSGKTTIVKAIMAEYKDLVFSISATTRSSRLNEKDGIDYFFLDEKRFKELIEKNEFIEWERFYDYYYGTLRSFVESNINNGKSLVLEVDVK